MLASKNTRPAVTTPEQGLHWIGVLGGELNVRLRESREVAPGLWPKTLVLSYRTGTSSVLPRPPEGDATTLELYQGQPIDLTLA
jgi:DNA polymerase eta